MIRNIHAVRTVRRPARKRSLLACLISAVMHVCVAKRKKPVGDCTPHLTLPINKKRGGLPRMVSAPLDSTYKYVTVHPLTNPSIHPSSRNNHHHAPTARLGGHLGGQPQPQHSSRTTTTGWLRHILLVPRESTGGTIIMPSFSPRCGAGLLPAWEPGAALNGVSLLPRMAVQCKRFFRETKASQHAAALCRQFWLFEGRRQRRRRGCPLADRIGR